MASILAALNADVQVQQQLQQLRLLMALAADGGVPLQQRDRWRDLQHAWRFLGQRMGLRLAEACLQPLHGREPVHPVCISCAVWDADGLAAGLLDGLKQGAVPPALMRLNCFWNEDRLVHGQELAPAWRQHVETHAPERGAGGVLSATAHVHMVVESSSRDLRALYNNLLRSLSLTGESRAVDDGGNRASIQHAPILLITPMLVPGERERLHDWLQASLPERLLGRVQGCLQLCELGPRAPGHSPDWSVRTVPDLVRKRRGQE